MASCNNCKKDVGCTCNLFDGTCITCYGKTQQYLSHQQSINLLQINQNSGLINEIIKNGLSKTEILERINSIIDSAKTN